MHCQTHSVVLIHMQLLTKHASVHAPAMRFCPYRWVDTPGLDRIDSAHKAAIVAVDRVISIWLV